MRNSTTSDDHRLHTEDLVSDSSPAKSTVDPRTDGPHTADRSTGGHHDDQDATHHRDADQNPDRTADGDRGEHHSGFATADVTDPRDTDRQSGQSDRGNWDGAPTYEAQPPVDPNRSPGYPESTEQPQAEHGQRERGTPAAGEAEEPGAELFADAEVERFRGEWSKVQANFVDDPREAVRDADHLVAEVMQNLAKTFAEHKRGLEGQWQGGGDSEAHTEDLRQALRRYRSFFNQLLHT